MTERRSHRRTKIQRLVEIEPVKTGRRARWTLLPGRGPELTAGKLIDIGLGGMCAAFGRRFDIGTICNVRIEGPTGTMHLTHGTVRNVRDEDGTMLVGIEFIEPLMALGDPAKVGESVGYPGVEPFALVVDDEPSVRVLLERFLRGRGMRVKTAAGGSEALEMLRCEAPALLLLDLRMPGVSGIQLLESITAEGLQVPQIWAMSGYATDAEALAAMSLGAADFLNKPFDLNQLDHNLQLLSPLL